MEKNFKFFLKLFWSMFCISAFTFGGGYVIVSMIKKKFVDEYKWIDETEMLDLTVIAQSSPGAIAVNASIVIGYKLAGILGCFVAVIATVLPPLISISIISIAYDAFRDNKIVNLVLRGMQAAVAAVVFDVFITMAKDIFKSREKFAITIMILAFVCACILQINVMYIIIACAIIGVTFTIMRERKKGGTK